MALSFSFELCVDTEIYERGNLFEMSGYSSFEHGVYGEADCYTGMKISEHITLIEIMREANGTPTGLRLSCEEANFGEDPGTVERMLRMGDELYVSNINYITDHSYRLRLKRTLRYEDCMKDALVWVDDLDNETGYGDKPATHRDRILHRAFSVFIYNWRDRKMLLQCRADGKYHSGGLWCNACCSHPRFGETMLQTINRRLYEELGLNCSLGIADPDFSGCKIDANNTMYACGTFIYHTDFVDMGEDELDHVFLLFTDRADISADREISFEPDEIKAVRWMSLRDIESDYSSRPGSYSAWFQPAYALAIKVLKRQASRRGIDIE